MFDDYKDEVIATLKKYGLDQYVSGYTADDAEQAWHEYRQEIMETDTLEQARAMGVRLFGFAQTTTLWMSLYQYEIEALFKLYLKWRDEMLARHG